jgi:hypothetical protein
LREATYKLIIYWRSISLLMSYFIEKYYTLIVILHTQVSFQNVLGTT